MRQKPLGKKAPPFMLPPNYWLITFSDLLTLLLGFFVLRLSMSSLDNDLFRFSIQSLAQQNIIDKNASLEPQLDLTHTQSDKPSDSLRESSTNRKKVEQAPLHQVVDALASSLSPGSASQEKPSVSKEAAQMLSAGSDISLKEEPNGSTIFLGGSTFSPGSDELSFRAKEFIMTISKILREKSSAGIQTEVAISGHADNTPVNNPRFASNWELSAARAISVARQMIDAGVDPRTVSVIGYGDTKPIADNLSAAGRHLNRRIELSIRSISTSTNPAQSGGT